MTGIQKVKGQAFSKVLYEYFMISVGTTFLALAICLFFDPLAMVTGGVTGIGVILNHTVGISVATANIFLNVPLFIMAFIILGKGVGVRSIYSTFFLSFALKVSTALIGPYLGYSVGTHILKPLVNDLLLASIFGGVLAGVGLGIVLRYGATTGGTELAAAIIHKFVRHIPVATLLFMLDGAIIVLGVLVQKNLQIALYGILSIYVTAKMIDNIVEGVHFAKAAFIISDKSDEIADGLMEQLDRGVTGLQGQGMFTKHMKNVLLCVVSRQEVVKLKEFAKQIDPRAFIIVADVREVLGEGFKEE